MTTQRSCYTVLTVSYSVPATPVLHAPVLTIALLITTHSMLFRDLEKNDSQHDAVGKWGNLVHGTSQ